MGMFANLMSKVFGHSTAAAKAAPPAAPATPAVPSASPTPAATPSAAAPVEAAKAAAAPAVSQAVSAVDVTAILDGMAKKNSEKLDWRKSIVDLLKLVGMDSSLAARKELAKDLGYTGDAGDSATMNVWLIKEVLKKFAANGGKIPPELLH